MYGYVCFYNGKRIELNAKHSLDAKLKAVNIFKPPISKRHMVSVVLAEADGQEVLHTASF